MKSPIYDDGTYIVTDAVIATRRRFYPLANVTASLRRDPLWFGIGLLAFGGACLAIYGDLLRPHEMVILAALCVLGPLAGNAFVILRIDAAGHPRTFIVGRRRRVERLFAAILGARGPNPGVSPEECN